MMIRTLSAAAVLLVAVLAPAQAATLVAQDFESGSVGFTGGSAVGSQGYAALGFGNQFYQADSTPVASALWTFNLASAASATTLSASLAIIDSWDNGNFCCGPDILSVKLDGNSVFSAVFDNYLNGGPTVATGLTTLSYGSNLGFNDTFNDAAYTLTLALGSLAAGPHTLEFVTSSSSEGWQGGTDESLGVDNLQITGTLVPEPGSALLLAVGLAGMVGAARRRAARV
jgi:hypothetical protein